LAEHDLVPKHVLIVAVACVMVTTTVRPGLADDGSSIASWLAQRTATGTWGGARDALELRGVSVELGYAADFAGNVSGGDRRGSGYAGFAVAGLGVDLEKLVGLHGTALTVRTSATCSRYRKPSPPATSIWASSRCRKRSSTTP